MNIVRTSIVLAGVAACASVASARIPLGIMGTDGQDLPIGPYLAFNGQDESTDHVVITGATGGPIQTMVVNDPNKRWHKIIEWNRVAEKGIAPGDMLQIEERFTFNFFPGTPSIDITDWHEDLKFEVFPIENGTLSWAEEASFEVDFFDGNGFVPAPGLSTMVMDPSIWFLFDPINPADAPNFQLDIRITKKLVYDGPEIPPTSTFPPFVLVLNEYPTPTPGTPAAVGLAGLFAARRRR